MNHAPPLIPHHSTIMDWVRGAVFYFVAPIVLSIIAAMSTTYVRERVSEAAQDFQDRRITALEKQVEQERADEYRLHNETLDAIKSVQSAIEKMHEDLYRPIGETDGLSNRRTH